jgi:hypothetical protein
MYWIGLGVIGLTALYLFLPRRAPRKHALSEAEGVAHAG